MRISFTHSVKEVACAGVPGLFLPMFAEQVRNSMMADRLGYGKQNSFSPIINTTYQRRRAIEQV